MKITPLFDNIVLKAIDNTPSTTGLIIPVNTNEKPNIATIISIGTGGIVDGENVEFKVKPNDKVLFNKYATSQFILDNEIYYLIKQCDILAIINEGEKNE